MVRGIVNAIVKVVKAIWNAIVAVVKWIVSAIKSIWDWIVGLFDGLWDWILAVIIIIILVFISWWTGIGWELIMYVWEWFMALDWVVAATSWFTDLMVVYELAGFWNAVIWVGGQLGGWLVSAFSAIWSWAQSAGGWAASAAGSVWDVAKTAGGALGSAASWLAGVLSDNPGLLALGAATATGLLDWLLDNWQIVAIGAGAYLLYSSSEGSSSTNITIQKEAYADRS